jgi:hypothetical protein
MIITNNANLPMPFVRMAEDNYEIKPKRYSVTTLLKPVREILLKRRYNGEIKQDCSDMIWLLFGKAVHSILEQYSDGESEFAEEKLTVKLENGYTVSGIIDLYDIDKAEVVDYKTASVWKVIYKDYEDWRKQGLAYAWLLRKNGFPCNKVVFYAILKDFNTTKAKTDHEYPQSPVVKVEFNIGDIEEMDRYIRDKIDEIISFENKPDAELPLCSAEERWNDGNKYAVMKKGRKTAMRVLDTINAAEEWKSANGGDFIETRKGIDKKCSDYCLCCMKCDYWQSLQGELNE